MQRYVSRELSHFVAREALTEEDQYGTLLEILRSGALLHSPAGSTTEGGYAIEIQHGARMSANAVFAAQAVCFCDIPVEDLELHVRKYSRFGLAFFKPFLLEKGANPAFYVARDSKTSTVASPAKRGMTRADAFDTEVAHYQELTEQLQDAESRRTLGGSTPLDAWQKNWGDMLQVTRATHFLATHLFGFVLFFDATAADEDPENLYMEREWRVMGNVNFGLQDVRRVFLPEAFAVRFRADLPDYCGQLTFIDAPSAK